MSEWGFIFIFNDTLFCGKGRPLLSEGLRQTRAGVMDDSYLSICLMFTLGGGLGGLIGHDGV